ncbi:MAG: ABC transporter substrate-binding protein [Chloroflexota bacterium]
MADLSDPRDRGRALISSTPVTRRQMLQASVASVVAVGAGGFLAACGGSTSPTPAASSGGGGTATTAPSAAPSDAGAPKKGGTLRFGAQGGAASDSLDAHNPITNTDYARVAQLYDQLVRFGDDGVPEFVLADSIEPNADATEWTIRVKKGVVTHDGKPFGAKDVLFSFKRIMDNKFPGAGTLLGVNIAGSKVIDDLTMTLKFDAPFSILKDALGLVYYYMVPEGYDPANPIGTGPFKLKSFTAGVESQVVRNDSYWMPGMPYLDGIITTNVADETAQVNGLQSGQFDCVNYLTAASIAALQGAYTVTIAETGSWGPITMRVDTAPFDDVRVRQALRLVVDRPQMLKQVFGGNGSIGNDVFGTLDPLFTAPGPQRAQDIEQAKALLKEAGKENLTLELVTTPSAPGMVQVAEVFATQAKAAGITVNITNQTPTDYFAQSYLKVAFSQDYWPYQPYLVTVSQGTLGTAPFNATHQNDPDYDAMFKKALATPDDAGREAIIAEMLKFDFEKGGNIIPYHFPVIDATVKTLNGVTASATGQALGAFNFKAFWFSS